MTVILGQRGATTWDCQVGKLWLSIPYKRFRRAGCSARLRWV